MKNLIYNLIWLVALTLIAYFVIIKIQKANDQCIQGITRIESILNTWELSN